METWVCLPWAVVTFIDIVGATVVIFVGWPIAFEESSCPILSVIIFRIQKINLLILSMDPNILKSLIISSLFADHYILKDYWPLFAVIIDFEGIICLILVCIPIDLKVFLVILVFIFIYTSNKVKGCTVITTYVCVFRLCPEDIFWMAVAVFLNRLLTVFHYSFYSHRS